MNRTEKMAIAQVLLKAAAALEAMDNKPGQKIKAALSEGEFWRIVDQIGWGTKTTDYKKIKKALMTKFSPEEAEEFSDMKSMFEGKLYQRLKQKTDIWLGGDSGSDFIAHIVGLGKDEYEKVMQHPTYAEERYNRGDFVESFDYAVPFKSDYQYLMADKYIERAKRLLDENYPLDKESDELNRWRNPIREPESPQGQRNMKIVRQALQKLARGDVDGFRRVEQQVRKAAGELEDEIGSNRWAVWNIYTDMSDYMD